MEKILAPKKVLVVDPDPTALRALWNSGGFIADIEQCGDFEGARTSLMRSPPDFLVTSLRLGAYNGLHLIYLAKTNRHGTRSICYSMFIDLPLIKEAQSIGAFYEAPARVSFALVSYLRTALPSRDRRQPREDDRRKEFRGGRRSADVALVSLHTLPNLQP
jgi:DNA-binding NtrC family response regulator